MGEEIRALLPFTARELGGLPTGVVAGFYDGTAEPTLPTDQRPPRPFDVADTEFYVLPYQVPPGPKPFELIARMPRLRVVQALFAGVDAIAPHIPTGVTLCNARGVHDTSTAELALALTLAVRRCLPEFMLAQRGGGWPNQMYPALADSTVLLLGYGAIGRAVEARLRPFEVEVLRVARTARDGVAGVADLPDLLPRADVVICVLPLTPDTRGLLDRAMLARMRDGATLVNVGRGSVVDTDALLAEVSAGRLRAGLDVTDPEPLPAAHPLRQAPGVLISPHVGGASSAFWPRARRLVRGQLERYAAGEPVEHVVPTPDSGGDAPS